MQKHAGEDAVIWRSDSGRCYHHLPTHTSVKHVTKQWAAVRNLEFADGSILCCYDGIELRDG